MDFINKLTGDHTANPHTNDQDGRLVDRIGSTYDDKDKTNATSSLADKISSAFSPSHSTDPHATNPATGILSNNNPHTDDAKVDNKIGSAFSDSRVDGKPPTAAGTRGTFPSGPSEVIHHSNPHAQPGLMDKISSVFTHTPQNASETYRDDGPPPPPKDSYIPKLTDTFQAGQRGTTTAAPRDEEGWAHTHGALASRSQNQEEAPHSEGIMGKINGMLGGGTKGEAKEDHLDKAIDAFQEHVLKQGPQHNESAMEQAKDGQIADAIRTGFKSMTGRDFPIPEKK